MKKVISIILAVLIAASVFSVVQVTVSAAETEDTAVEAKTEENEIGATSGTTGDCTWTLDNGVLIISGNGAMGNFSSTSSSLPWGRNITLVIIEDGVTKIGDYAFYSCTKLSGIVIPDSVTSIGSSAFSGCKSLTSVTIPDSVTSIGNYAFSSCAGLTSITIPDSVTSIGNYAFEYCTGLKSVTIPDSVTSIGNWAFSHCTGLTSITIPDSVTSISYQEFYGCTGLTSVTIPDSVKSIGSSAFYGCESLTSVTIPDSVTSIGSSAFYGCTGLTSVTIPDSVTSIGYLAFYGCTGLTSVTIPDSVTIIGEEAFYGCIGLTSINIGKNVKKYINAFKKCISLESVIVSEKNNTFDSRNNCNAVIKTENNQLVMGCKNTIIPDSVTSIGVSSFSNCTGLTSITIPDSVTSIGNYAFYGCTGLKSVTIPDSVTSIGNYAFYGCTGLKSVTIPDSVTSIGSNAFEDCTGLTSVTIGNSVTSIGSGAFSNCTGLTKVNISNIAAWCNINFNYFASNPLYYAHNLYLNNELVTELIIPDSVTSISSSAFYGCTGLTSVTIPDSVTSISSSAFYGCTGLTSVTIPDSVTTIGNNAFAKCTKLTIYGTRGSAAETYANNNNIPFVVLASGGSIENTTWSIDENDLLTINGNGNITDFSSSSLPPWGSYVKKVIINNGVTGIGDYTFYGCNEMISIDLPDCLTSIGKYAFINCKSLNKIEIPASVNNIGNFAFYGCDNLTIYGNRGTAAETYASSNNIPFVSLDVEPTTEEQTTVEPTEQPTTAQPTTVEATTVEPTEQPTTEPATLPYLNVNVISAVNSEGAEVLPIDFSLIGDSPVSVNKGDTFTLSWMLDNDSLVPESIQWFLTYDKDALQIVSAAMPETNEGSYLNKSVPGVVWGNVTNANGFTVDKDAEFITMTFKALDGNIKDTDVKMTVDQIIYKNSKPDQLIIDGEPANGIYDGKYYVDGYQKQVTGMVDVNGTFYLFDENYETEGVFSGLYTGESGTRYFQNGKPQNVGLIKIENEIYCTSSGGYLVHGDKEIYSSRTNGLLPPGVYHFDEVTGKLYKDNVIIDDVYYKEDKAANVGIVKVAGDFYVTTTKGVILKDVYDKPIYSGRTNGLVAVGTYDFGPDGKMILKNGIINGKYYKDGKATNIGCFAYEINGVTDIYCTTTNGVLIKNAQNKLIYNSRTNGLIAAGYYDFDTDGKMTIHKSE